MPSKWLTAVIAAGLSAYGCFLIAPGGSPIDASLPLIAVVVTAMAAVTRPSILLAAPLLMGGEMSIADERLRLLWFGAVLAAAGAAALTFHEDSRSLTGGAVITTSLVVLLRWIPLSGVQVWRELLLLVIALLTVMVLEGRALGISLAVAVCLFTPLIPLRTLILPAAVLVAMSALRFSPVRLPSLRAVSSLCVAVMLLFFAWSGALARATRLTLHGLPQPSPRTPVRMALAPGQSIALEVPAGAGAVILSGANVSRLKEGTPVGVFDGRVLRIGDLADWGFLRRQHFHGSRNRLPDHPAGQLHGYGQEAWIDGGARFALRDATSSPRRVVISAAATLPPAARLQVEAFELARP